MNINEYCDSLGMTKDEQFQYVSNLFATADAIKYNMYELHEPHTDLYYDVQKVLPFIPGETIPEQRGFIIHRLKQMGVEFFDNDTLYKLT